MAKIRLSYIKAKIFQELESFFEVLGVLIMCIYISQGQA